MSKTMAKKALARKVFKQIREQQKREFKDAMALVSELIEHDIPETWREAEHTGLMRYALHKVQRTWLPTYQKDVENWDYLKQIETELWKN